MQRHSFFSGLKLGMALQIGGIGPICLLLFQLATTVPLLSALQGVLAATIVDSLYITISVMGIMKFINKVHKFSKIFNIAISIVLILLGISFCLMAGSSHSEHIKNIWHFNNIFITIFCVNLLNPVAIVCYTGIFSAKAAGSNFTKQQLIFYASGVLTAAPLFLSFVVFLGHFGAAFFPEFIISILNLIVGLFLIYWGLSNLFPNLRIRKYNYFSKHKLYKNQAQNIN